MFGHQVPPDAEKLLSEQYRAGGTVATAPEAKATATQLGAMRDLTLNPTKTVAGISTNSMVLFGVAGRGGGGAGGAGGAAAAASGGSDEVSGMARKYKQEWKTTVLAVLDNSITILRLLKPVASWLAGRYNPIPIMFLSTIDGVIIIQYYSYVTRLNHRVQTHYTIHQCCGVSDTIYTVTRQTRFDALMVYCLWLKIALSTRGDKINKF